MKLQVRYFAELAELAGKPYELCESEAADLAGLYAELQLRYGFRFSQQALRAARNGEFASWSQALHEGDEIALLPPFSGG